MRKLPYGNLPPGFREMNGINLLIYVGVNLNSEAPSVRTLPHTTPCGANKVRSRFCVFPLSFH